MQTNRHQLQFEILQDNLWKNIYSKWNSLLSLRSSLLSLVPWSEPILKEREHKHYSTIHHPQGHHVQFLSKIWKGSQHFSKIPWDPIDNGFEEINYIVILINNIFEEYSIALLFSFFPGLGCIFNYYFSSMPLMFLK